MRSALLLIAALTAGFAVAQATDLGTTVALGAPTVCFTRSAGVHAARDMTAQLEQGENRLTLDTAALETDPATVRARVLEPAGQVRIVATTTGPQPGMVVLTVGADAPTRARLRLSYEVKFLQADTLYGLLLNPAQQKLDLQADLTVRNNGKHDLTGAKLTLPQGQQTTVSLQAGQTVQQQLFGLPEMAYQIVYLYDNNRFKDAVRTLLAVSAEARLKTPLPAGKARIYAPGPGGRAFVAEAGVPYVPAGEKLELDLGVAPELAVLRTRLRSDQVNVRSDVYRKLALFDLEEEFELELSNQRPGPVTVLVREHVAGDWQLLKGSHPSEQTDSGTLEWTIRLAGGAKEKLGYTVKRLNVEP